MLTVAFWLVVLIGIAGAAGWALVAARRVAQRRREHEARAMQVIAEAMRARDPGTSGPDSGSPPDRKPS